MTRKGVLTLGVLSVVVLAAMAWATGRLLEVSDSKVLEGVASVISAIASILWATFALVAGALLWRRLDAILGRDAEVELEVLGVKLKAGRDVARRLIEPVFDEVRAVVEQLGEEERRLFDAIRNGLAEPGHYTVPQGFTRSTRELPSQLHEGLRTLRRLSLIRPREGGNWKAGKHVQLTNFARLAMRIAGERLDKRPTLSSASSDAAAGHLLD
jgi:hypothetical protein